MERVPISNRTINFRDGRLGSSMAKTVIETFYGKFHKFDVVRDSGIFSTNFYVLKDGKPYESFSSLSAAVKFAKKKADG